jgi:hypothetical protein
MSKKPDENTHFIEGQRAAGVVVETWLETTVPSVTLRGSTQSASEEELRLLSGRTLMPSMLDRAF